MLGILYDADPGTSPATFLPSDLVLGVADDLRSQNRVVHGWLGVQGTDAPTAAAPRWPRCSPADRPPAACRWARSSWP